MKKIRTGFILTTTNRSLLALIIISIGLTLGIYVINNIKQPFLITQGYSFPQIGFITAFVSAFSAVLYIYGHKILTQFGTFKTLTGISLIGMATLLLISFSSPVIALVGLVLYQLTPSLRDPAITNLQQQHIQNDQRATANSTMSFFTRIIISLALPLWGLVIDQVGIHVSLVYLALLTSLITYIGFFFYKRAIVLRR